MKKFLIFALAALSSCVLSARVSSFGDPAKYGIKEFKSENFYDVNPYTWDTFISMDPDLMFGLSQKRSTYLNFEYASDMVIEGMNVGRNAFGAVLVDRGAFFGGDGYCELGAFMPTDANSAQQFKFAGGWKYNLTELFHLDLGGTFTYTTQRVSGPGIPGGGMTFYGDFYAGIIVNVPTNPFVYYMYNPDFDAQKIMVGINPIFELDEYFAIKNLSLELQAYYGYVASNRWTGDNKVGGRLMENGYGFVQTEVSLVYVWRDTWRFSVGCGYAYNNDGEGPSKELRNGPEQNVWVTTSVGFFF
ncbi:MAG: hypothetical protein HP060_03320 [Opitutales bacterium]|nr:hypothetical protein [Opitutales bacterium]